MIKDSAKELFEVVLVWKLDRFSRDRYDSAHYKHILKRNGVKVVSAKEHISEGPEGIILEAMLGGYAEFYSAELSEKIHRGQKENALKGKNNGGGIPLGYLLDKKEQKLVVDPVTAPLVIEVFERYASGETVRSIVEDFNARGLRTRKGRAFNINSFGSLLKNRKYIGEYRYQDVVIVGGVPAIVPEDLFYRVQERMEKNRHAPAMSKAKKEEILVSIQTAERQKPKLTREQMTAWFEQFRHGDPENRDFQKRLIDTFVNSVYLFDDKLVLTYNYQHETQTISLEEIESALSSDLRCGSPPPQTRTAFCFAGFLL